MPRLPLRGPQTVVARAQSPPDIASKRCTGCLVAKAIADFATAWGKPIARCKECIAAYYRERRQANPEASRQRQYAWNAAHPELRREYAERTKAKNRESILARKRAKRAETPPEIRQAESRANYRRGVDKHGSMYARYRETYRAQYKRYMTEHPEKYAEYANRRRARISNALREPVDRRAIIERDNSTCYICNTILSEARITLDHVIPLSKGGSHTGDNLRVCCKSCNSKKGARID